MKDTLNQESCISWRFPTFMDLQSSSQQIKDMITGEQMSSSTIKVDWVDRGDDHQKGKESQELKDAQS